MLCDTKYTIIEKRERVLTHMIRAHSAVYPNLFRLQQRLYHVQHVTFIYPGVWYVNWISQW